jgi:carbonic anhydrase
MKKLIQGIVDFRKNLTKESRALFAKLALGQKPDTLFIACSDSRVVPNLFASTDPGDLFVLRNIGNLIPPFSCSCQDDSAAAVIEFSISSLKVSDIVVCGHSECAAMLALSKGIDTLACPHLESWLKYGKEALKERLEKKQLRVHGWWFDIAQADVYCYEQNINQFVLIDEKEAQQILKRLGS